MYSKYPVWWQKLLGSTRSGSTVLNYRNCVITPGWWLMRAVYRMYFHMYDEKKCLMNIIYTVAHEFVLTSQAVPSMSYLSYLDGS